MYGVLSWVSRIYDAISEPKERCQESKGNYVTLTGQRGKYVTLSGPRKRYEFLSWASGIDDTLSRPKEIPAQVESMLHTLGQEEYMI